VSGGGENEERAYLKTRVGERQEDGEGTPPSFYQKPAGLGGREGKFVPG